MNESIIDRLVCVDYGYRLTSRSRAHLVLHVDLGVFPKACCYLPSEIEQV